METSNLENEIKLLKETNSELVQKVQYFKLKASQSENDKLDLMKENNDLRLKLSRLQSAGAAQARALDSAIQSTSEQALNHLVQASTAFARTVELAKAYTRDRQDLDLSHVRWSTIGGTPVKEKVHKVAPMMLGGKSIQPFVSLNRMPLNNSNSASAVNPHPNVTERVLPLPMHVLQDVYIPLRRIDASEFMNVSNEEVQPPDEENEEFEENQEMQHRESEQAEAREYEDSGPLNVINEESELEEDVTNPNISRIENPLEGPSWLLDVPRRRTRDKVKFEPDSTTEPDESTSNIALFRQSLNQCQSQSPILESRTEPRVRSGNLDLPGCSHSGNQRTETNSSSPIETKSSSSLRLNPRLSTTPRPNVTVRRKSPLGGVVRQGEGEGSMTPPMVQDEDLETSESPQMLAFTPTVRRKRTSPLQPVPSPSLTPSPSAGRRARNKLSKTSRNTNENKILKVIVPKIDMDTSMSGDSRDGFGNTSAIEANRSELEANTTDIEANTSNLEANTSNLEANRTDIEANIGNFEANRTEVEANNLQTDSCRSANESNVNISETRDESRDIEINTNNFGEGVSGVKKKGGTSRKKRRNVKQEVVTPPKRRVLCHSPRSNSSGEAGLLSMDRESDYAPSIDTSEQSDVDTDSRSRGNRRQRKPVTYREVPLNVKLRR